MNLKELYDLIPAARHPEIVVSGDRLFFDGEEYIIGGDGELKLVHSYKGLEQAVARIETKLGIK